MMKRIVWLSTLALMVSGAGCSGGGSAGLSDGAAATGGTSGGTGGAPGTGGGGGGGSSSCACAGPLAVDLTGDGEPLHLTSGDYSGGGHENLPNANLAEEPSDITAVDACVADARPWAESTTGGGSVLYWVQACAGPGAAPPCVWLNANAPNPVSLGSLYVDRSGQAIRGYVDMRTSSFQSFQTPLSETIEGTFTLVLQDGRTLTATFRVCLLASVNFG